MKAVLFTVIFVLASLCSARLQDDLSSSLPLTLIAEERLQWTTCASISDCNNCTATTGCHFCASDRKCHAYLSPDGCAVGLSCATLDCIRTQPKFKGYAKPSAGLVIGSIVLCLFCLLSLFCLYASYVKYHTHKQNQRYATRLHDAAFLDDDVDLDASPDVNLQPMTAIQTGSAPLIIQPKNRRSSSVSRSRPHPYRKCQIATIVMAVVVVVLAILMMLLYPQMPTYSVCNRRVDWTSMLTSLAERRIALDLELHFAVYNPNRIGVDVHQVKAKCYYKDEEVAQATTGRASFPAGSIGDVVALAHFQPSGLTAARMLAAHLNGTLELDVLLELHTDVMVFDRKIHNLNTTFAINQLSPNAPSSKELCKCQDSS